MPRPAERQDHASSEIGRSRMKLVELGKQSTPRKGFDGQSRLGGVWNVRPLVEPPRRISISNRSPVGWARERT
jgi:hypothetical protein